MLSVKVNVINIIRGICQVMGISITLISDNPIGIDIYNESILERIILTNEIINSIILF